MSYVGWKILAYRYHHDKPEQQAPISKEELVNSVRQSFQSPDWSMAEHRGRLVLTHLPTQSEVNLEVHGEEVEIEYEDGPRTLPLHSVKRLFGVEAG
jgi:hypothetical protein